MPSTERVWQEISHALAIDYANTAHQQFGARALADLLNSTIDLQGFSLETPRALERQYLHRYGDILSLSRREFAKQREMGSVRTAAIETYLTERNLRFRLPGETLTQRLEDLYGGFYWIPPSIALRHLITPQYRVSPEGQRVWADLEYHMRAARSAHWMYLGDYLECRFHLGPEFTSEDHARITDWLTRLGLMRSRRAPLNLLYCKVGGNLNLTIILCIKKSGIT